MIENYFLPKDLCVELKSLGFDQNCLMYWDNKGDLKPHNPPYYYKNGVFISSPIYEQVFEWIKNTFNLHITTGTDNEGSFYTIVGFDEVTHIERGGFNSVSEMKRSCFETIVTIIKKSLIPT
jgi:hypothetical protein